MLIGQSREKSQKPRVVQCYVKTLVLYVLQRCKGTCAVKFQAQ